MKKISKSVSFILYFLNDFCCTNSIFLDVMDLMREKFPDTFQDPKAFDTNQNLSEMRRHGTIFW